VKKTEPDTPSTNDSKPEDSNMSSPDSADMPKLNEPISQFELDPKTPDTKVKFVGLSEDEEAEDSTEDVEEVVQVEEENPSHVGKFVRKYFDGHGWFNGKVMTQNEVELEGGAMGLLWTVTYDDGDSEELSAEDLDVYMTEYRKFATKSKDSTSLIVQSTSALATTSKPVSAPTTATAVSVNKTKPTQQSSSKKNAWCPEGWTIEDRPNPPDAKSKPGELVKTWVAPDGKAFKTLKAAVSCCCCFSI
jgi:hypothetical protein